MAERWDPWSDLEARWPRVVFGVAELPAETGGAVWYSDGQGVVIVLDPSIEDPRHRTHLLAHELVHDERGAPWRPALAREEREVERVVARRLVPLEELQCFVDHELSIDNGVDATAVATHFDVTEAAARTAMIELASARNAGS